MAVASLFAGLALSKESRLERALRRILVGAFRRGPRLVRGLSLLHRMDVEYRFEVAAITAD